MELQEPVELVHRVIVQLQLIGSLCDIDTLEASPGEMPVKEVLKVVLDFLRLDPLLEIVAGPDLANNVIAVSGQHTGLLLQLISISDTL